MHSISKDTGYKNIYDLAGIGIGPFNLGLSALLEKIKNIKSIFFDEKPCFSWHENTLLNNSAIQVHYLKDLVTLVDPSNKYSFLSYLALHKRLYQFVNKKNNIVSRMEFNQYFQWASKNLSNLIFSQHIKKVEHENKYFSIYSDSLKCRAKNIVIGTGIKPYIPNFLNPLLSSTVFHSLHYLKYKKTLNFKNKRIIIVGGGQSGAEVFDDLISSENLPIKITWVSKRANFQPLEDACFSNEFYTPSYINYFRQLPLVSRQNILSEQKLTSDGITQTLADSIYNKLYELKFIKKENINFNLLIRNSVSNVKKIDNLYKINITNLDNQENITESADIIILATGFAYQLPECISTLLPDVSSVKDLSLNKDYSIAWEHSQTNKIYIQNGVKNFFGVADPNLSLAPWRNAVIINSLAKKELYKIDGDSPFINYSSNMASLVIKDGDESYL